MLGRAGKDGRTSLGREGGKKERKREKDGVTMVVVSGRVSVRVRKLRRADLVFFC